MDTIQEAINAIAAGKAVLVMDDEGRENEGDIIFAAQFATSELVGWTVRYSSGVLCVPMLGDRAEALELPQMVANNQDSKGTAYTVSCDAAEKITTGISATDRALGARVLASVNAKPTDITRPGHLFPLVAKKGLLKERQGHTEAAVVLCQLAQVAPVGVIAELVADTGEMLRGPAVQEFGKQHNCPVITIEDLIIYLAEQKDSHEKEQQS
ncbi:MAG: 3,4-dihydroxy-2-butanone-4-phosphate synthase [Micrococcaceae bacterium]